MFRWRSEAVGADKVFDAGEAKEADVAHDLQPAPLRGREIDEGVEFGALETGEKGKCREQKLES